MTADRAGALLIHAVDRPLFGRVLLPGSKSITNRALLIAALARGTSVLSGALKSDDTRHMATALAAMGASVEEPDSTSFRVESDGLRAPHAPLFVGNAGTAARFLTAAAATVHGTVLIDGDPAMRRRPIQPLVEALRAAGVAIVAPTGCLPATIKAQGLRGGSVAIDATLSSQYVSALLMASACAENPTEIRLTDRAIGARGYIPITLAVMRAFGGQVDEREPGLWTVAPTGYHAADFQIEADASAATYFWAAAAITGGQIDVGIADGSSLQPDAAARSMIAAFPHFPSCIDGSQIQDAIPTVATLAARNQGEVRFTGIANLRVKECDRIAAIAQGLQNIRPGLAAVEGDDLIVRGDPTLRHGAGALIQTFDDHRIAMAFAMLGLGVGNIRILDPDCTAKTFPSFWTTLAALGVTISPASTDPERLG